jgi:hypothetical protein
MTLDSQNSPFLENGSLTQVSMEMLIRRDRLGTERDFHVSGISKGSHGYAQATNIFQGYALDCKSGSSEKIDSVVLQFRRKSVVREFSVQLWSVNQRTTEAEGVIDS